MEARRTSGFLAVLRPWVTLSNRFLNESRRSSTHVQLTKVDVMCTMDSIGLGAGVGIREHSDEKARRTEYNCGKRMISSLISDLSSPECQARRCRILLCHWMTLLSQLDMMPTLEIQISIIITRQVTFQLMQPLMVLREVG